MSSPTKRKAGETTPQKGGAALSTQTIEYLRAWMMSPEHVEHPYPNEQEKAKIMEDTRITSKQLTCWFSNNRKRFWKPRMEEMGRHDIVEAAMGNTLSPHVIEYLKAWMMHPDHIQNPYPTEEEKAGIIVATGIGKKQLTCWFSNNRKRFWKPKMDKLREQYGLSETDPLPAALLATAATPAPPPDDINHDMYAAAPASALPLETLSYYAPIAPLPLETSFAPAFPLEAAVEPVAPHEDFSADLYASIDTNACEFNSEEPSDNKRQKVSLDDVVAV
mmetsp:Transcript_872/g.1768  ORF Transcript_872/g.1768 Transcript_872/m.1768 type:complete len:276 (-) Transcript_872:243-1070(-)